MSADTKIEWTDKTWNPVRGCSLVSKGCEHCYAMKQAHRFSGRGQSYEGLTKLTSHGPVWTGKVRLVPELVDQPFHWAKPCRIFVNSMSDLFHEDVPFQFIADVFATMSVTTRHTYQILTKRPARMLDFFAWLTYEEQPWFNWPDQVQPLKVWPQWTPQRGHPDKPHGGGYDNCGPGWPLENVHLGVSVENQETANERIPLLLRTPAAVRWISAEPLLSRVDLCESFGNIWRNSTTREWMREERMSNIHWVVVGGESGPGARTFDVAWARSIIVQCKAAGVPVFCKQLGANARWYGIVPMMLRDRKGGNWDEWPADLRVREYPAAPRS